MVHCMENRDLRFIQEGIREKKPWWVVETRHYILMFDEVSKNVVKPSRFAMQVETRLVAIARLLGMKRDKTTKRCPLGPLIPYFIHDPAACKIGSVDERGIDVPAGRAAVFLRHEESHAILSRAFGGPPPLFFEGFAMYAQAPRSNDNHRAVLSAWNGDGLPLPHEIADWKSFWKRYKVYRQLMYQEAGSFVAFLLKRFGHRKFEAFCRSSSYGDTKAKVTESFRNVYRVSMREAERSWRSCLLKTWNHLRLTRSRARPVMK